MKLNVREGKVEDFKGISGMIKQLHGIHVSGRSDFFKEIDESTLKEGFQELIKDKEVKMFVVEDFENNKIVAYGTTRIMNTPISLIINEKKLLYIADFCVDEEYKRQKIGQLLMNTIIEYAKEQGVYAVELTVWEFNKSAIEFYEKLGFTTRNRKLEMIFKK